MKMAPIVRALVLAGQDDASITAELCERLGAAADPEQVRSNVGWYRREMIRSIKACKPLKVAALEAASVVPLPARLARAWYNFAVVGVGEFPLDLLRFDCCFPANGDSVAALATSADSRLVELASTVTPPTEGRWALMGWPVVANSQDIQTYRSQLTDMRNLMKEPQRPTLVTR